MESRHHRPLHLASRGIHGATVTAHISLASTVRSREGYATPHSWASAAASPRELTPTLSKIFATWNFTVDSLMLAAARGAVVIGTASEANHDYLRSLGAIRVTYGAGLADRVRAAVPQGVDAVYDAAGHDALDVSIELRGGTTDRIVTICPIDRRCSSTRP